MANKIFYQEDCNLGLLDGKTIAIIGYGSQGASCPGGGIGRRARFRCVCLTTCRFESCSGHTKKIHITRRGGGIGRRATLRG